MAALCSLTCILTSQGQRNDMFSVLKNIYFRYLCIHFACIMSCSLHYIRTLECWLDFIQHNQLFYFQNFYLNHLKTFLHWILYNIIRNSSDQKLSRHYWEILTILCERGKFEATFILIHIDPLLHVFTNEMTIVLLSFSAKG